MKLKQAPVCLGLAIIICGCGGSMESSAPATDGENRACRRIDSEPDGFGGVVRRVRIWDDLAGGGGKGVLDLIETGGVVRVGIGVGLNQWGDYTLPSGSTFEIRFADDEILIFQSEAATEGAITQIGWSALTLAMSEFQLSAPQLAQFAGQDAIGLRVTQPNGTVSAMPISSGDSEHIQTAAGCFLF